MENSQHAGTRYAQNNLDAAVSVGSGATRFWRKCAELHAQGTNQMLEESLRITTVILKTQSDMVEAAGQFLSEGQRVMSSQAPKEEAQREEAQRTPPVSHGSRRAS